MNGLLAEAFARGQGFTGLIYDLLKSWIDLYPWRNAVTACDFIFKLSKGVIFETRDFGNFWKQCDVIGSEI